MDRLLTRLHSQSLLFLFPSRHLSSYKSNSFDLKSRTLLNLVKQFDASKQNLSLPPSEFDITYELNPFFPLPGRIGFARETKPILKLDPNHYNKTLQEKHSLEQLINTHTISSISAENFLSKLINDNNNLEIRTYDCPPSLRSELHHLFLNYDILTQPLTAMTVIFKTNSDMSTWSTDVENERNQLIEQFTQISHQICTYLNTKQYWVDFIDPSNGKPYYGPPTSDALFETDQRLRHFGVNTVDLGCCRVIEHLQYGTHVFVGCIFTSAPKTDPNIQHLLKEFVVPNCSEQK